MKKLLLTLGSIASVIAPITAAISCGEDSKKNKTNTNKTNAETITPVVDGNNTDNTPAPHGESHVSASNYDIQEDGLFLRAQDYNGQLWNGGTKQDGAPATSDLVKIGRKDGWSHDKLIQFGDGDSFYAMYDTDDEDGLSLSNLTSTFNFIDTSIMGTDEIKRINEGFGLQSTGGMFGGRSVVPLKPADEHHGALGNYVGAQNNHIGHGGYATEEEFQNAVKRFVAIYGIDHEVVTEVFNYYGLSKTQDANGNYEDSPSRNHASRGFAPVVQLDPVLTYEVLDNRTVKFTWHIKEFKATAAHFTFGKENGKWLSYGLLSIGNKDEWDSYIRYSDSRYLGIKKQYLNNPE